jgi:endonuclease/exonuclease/phosphatase (EEP) superfamily protein YafD
MFKGLGGEHFYNDLRLLSFQSDFLLLQEALLSRRSLAELAPHGFLGVHGASYERADRLRDGVMTLARVGNDHAPQRILCKYPEPLLRTPKAALVTIYPLEGQTERLMIVNIHATLIRTIRRAVEELDHVLAQLPFHSGPIIFAGDFNTFTPQYFKAVVQKLAEFGLQYVTIPGDPRRGLDHLDQLFVRGLLVKEVWVDTKIRSSDHFPIRAVLELIGND